MLIIDPNGLEIIVDESSPTEGVRAAIRQLGEKAVPGVYSSVRVSPYGENRARILEVIAHKVSKFAVPVFPDKSENVLAVSGCEKHQTIELWKPIQPSGGY